MAQARHQEAERDLRNSVTERWLYPSGFYCVVRRFSSKEEKRRVVASVVDPAPSRVRPCWVSRIISVFHDDRRGLTADIARGLAVFLNTTAIDQYFRRFNGHTQVNATDLKGMKYPKPGGAVGSRKMGESSIRYRRRK